MTGYEYEVKCAKYLEDNGFTQVTVTPGSGDQGIDVIAFKEGKKYGIQCKYYEGTVGNKAVQEAYAGAAFYSCDIAMVITNASFTKQAQSLALKLGVVLQGSVDAIAFYESSKAIDESLTPEEKEKAEVARLERKMQERLRLMRAKFPENKAKDDEIAKYVNAIKQKATDLAEDYERRSNSIYERMRYQSFRSSRDPSFIEYKGLLRETCQQYSGRFVNMLEAADHNASDYLSSGISEKSVELLISLIRHIYSEGDLSVNLNGQTIAKTRWTAKHERIVSKWTDYRKQLPSIWERNQKADEATYMRHAKENLASAKKQIKQIEDELSKLAADVAGRDGELSTLQAELIENEAVRDTCKKVLSEKREELQRETNPLQIELSSVETDLAELSAQVASTKRAYESQSLFAFKAKKELREHLDDLDQRMSRLKAAQEELTRQIEAINTKYLGCLADTQAEYEQVNKQHQQIKRKITKISKEIENRTAEKAIRKKKTELRSLKSTLPELEEQVKNAHKNYLKQVLQI